MEGTPRGKGYSKEEMEARRSLARLQRMVPHPPTPAAIERHLREKGGYVGQQDAVATLCLGMAIHARRIWHRVYHDADPRSLPRVTHLLIGPSGGGKSHLVGQLARWGLGGDRLPYLRSDMNRITEFGYWGGDVDQIVAGVIAAAGGDQAAAEGAGIVFCDEIDKLRSYGTPNHREVGGATAQAALLDLVEGQLMAVDLYARGAEGRNLRNTIQFDASSVWVVAAGAFSGLEGIVTRRLRPCRRIGFADAAAKPLDSALRRVDVLRHTEVEDLVAYGMLPELCNRMADIVVLDPLRAIDYRAMLDLKMPDAPVPQWKRLGESLGVEVRFTDGLLDAIAAAAEAEGLGARSLGSLVARACKRALCEVPERARSRLAHGVYPRCVLDVAALEDASYRLSWPKRTKKQIWGMPGWSDGDERTDEVGETEPGAAAG